MKKLWLVVLSGILILSFLLAGCGEAASTTAPASSVTPTATAPTTNALVPVATTAPKKVYELKFTDQFTPIMEDGQVNEMLGKLIEEKTGGQVKITYYHAEALGKTGDFLNLLDGGVADIANFIAGWFPEKFSFFMGLEIPTIGFTDRGSKLDVDWELLNKGYLKEFDNYKVLSFNVTPSMNLYMIKNSPDIASLKGKKIRASNATIRSWIENLGATPVAMASPDVYMALDRGTIDGVYTGYTHYLQTKYYEVCKYAIWNQISIGSSPIIMSKAAWNKLPPEVQAGVDQAIEEFKTVYLEFFNPKDMAAADELRKQSATVYSFEGENASKLAAAAAPLKEEWITTMQAKGLPAREMLDFVAKILAAK